VEGDGCENGVFCKSSPLSLRQGDKATKDSQREPMFSKLQPHDIDRLRRFGKARRFAAGPLGKRFSSPVTSHPTSREAITGADSHWGR
jgi:hypothetical protein